MQRKMLDMKKEKRVWLVIPVVLAVCIVPFLVLTKDYSIDFTQFIWYKKQIDTGKIDNFEYIKAVGTIFCAGICLLCIGVWFKISRREVLEAFRQLDKRVLILTGVYIFMAGVSSFASEYKELAFFGGGFAKWQSFPVLVSYIIIFLYSAAVMGKKERLFPVVNILRFFLFAMAALGTMQAAGNNPLKWKWVQDFITQFSSITGFTFDSVISDVVLTFSNPNYAGTYLCLVIPLSVILTAADTGRNAVISCVYKFVSLVTTLGFLYTLHGNGSSTGLIVLTVSGICVVIFLVHGKAAKVSSRQKKIKIAVFSFFVVLTAVFAFSFTPLAKETVNKFTDGMQDARALISIVNETDTRLTLNFRDKNVCYVEPSVDASGAVQIQVLDEKEQSVPVTYDIHANVYRIGDKRYDRICFTATNYRYEGDIYPGVIFQDKQCDMKWNFICKDGKWFYYSVFGRLISLTDIERCGFDGYEQFAHGRGYIWSRTLPLLKHYWFRGIGPNAFITAFPNTDFVGGMLVGGTLQIVDKPHNTFMDIWVQTGGVSAAAYAALWLLFIVMCFRYFWRRGKSGEVWSVADKILLGIFWGILAYGIAGLTNDTVIGGQIVYWTLLGTGMAVLSTSQ